jgi:hypothetical protein
MNGITAFGADFADIAAKAIAAFGTSAGLASVALLPLGISFSDAEEEFHDSPHEQQRNRQHDPECENALDAFRAENPDGEKENTESRDPDSCQHD